MLGWRPRVAALLTAASTLSLVVAFSGGSTAAAPVAAKVPRFDSAKCSTVLGSAEPIERARCGYLVVPENRDKRGGRTIRLAVEMAPPPANAKRPIGAPVVFMSGGPGGAALGLGPELVKMGLNADHELILMDQRGVGQSRPALNCPEFAEFRKRSIALPWDATSTGQLQVEAARACYQRLTREGIDVGAYNTTENATDFADLRRVLKIPVWNVYSGSYGTDLALIYMREHPQGVRSVIIDSVVPPDVATLSWTWTSDERGVDDVFGACAAQPRCKKHYPHLGRVFTSLVRKFEAHPMTTYISLNGHRTKVVFDGGTLVNWLQQHTIIPATIPADIYALARGDLKPAADLFAPLQSAEPLSRGMHFSVICSEWVPYEPQSAILKQGRRAFPAYPTSVLRQAPALPFFSEVCGAWRVPKAPTSVRLPTRSKIPTLSIGGGFDAVTGTQWAKYAVRDIANSTYINIPGVSHFVGLDSKCAQQVIVSFLGTPKTPNTRCVRGLKPAPFTIKPTQAPVPVPPEDDGPL